MLAPMDMPTAAHLTDRATALPAVGDALPSSGMPFEHLALPARPPQEPPLPVATPTDHLGTDWPAGLLHLALDNPSITGGLAVGLVLAIALLVSWRRGKVKSWIVAVSWIAAFGFSAEGMWYVAVDKADVPPVVAAGVFFVFELFQVRSMLAARDRYRATAVFDADGAIVQAGDPGKHGSAVWILAAVMGGIVALAAHSPADAALRLSIPLGAALLWWNDLTDNGVRRQRGSWRWTPRRLLLALGAIEPGERDFETVDRERRIAQMTVIAHKLHHGSARLAGWRAARLRRLTLAADDAMVAEVHRRVERVHAVEESTRPRVIEGVLVSPDPGVGSGAAPALTPGADPGGNPAPAPGADPGADPGGNAGISPGSPPGVEAGDAPGVGRAPSRAPTRVRPPSPKQVKALKLRADNPDMSAAEVARKVGADYKTVRGWLKTTESQPEQLPVGEPVPAVVAGVNGHEFIPSHDVKES